MSDSVRPHRRQPARLPHPWDSPGKNTGVGCHFLLQCIKVKSESEVAQSCPILSDPMDCSLLGSSVHGLFQARVLEWGAIAFSVIYWRGTLFVFEENFANSVWNYAKLKYIGGELYLYLKRILQIQFGIMQNSKFTLIIKKVSSLIQLKSDDTLCDSNSFKFIKVCFMTQSIFHLGESYM